MWLKVPRLDVPRRLPRSMILLKVSPRSQIMPPGPITENVFYPGHRETLSPVIFGKNGGLHWNRVFPAWFLVFWIIPQLGSWDSVLRVSRWIPDIWKVNIKDVLTNPCFYVFDDAFCVLHFYCTHFQAIFSFN